MNNKEEILNKLFALQRFGIKPGLERTLKLSNELGNPHKKLITIHVAGTNGKGAVCSILASILKEAGFNVGLYTSPHIKDFNERIRINGKKISDDDLVKLTNQLLPYQKKFNNTFFEITTVLAFQYFAERNVDIAILETGMGGKYDSTNIIQPLLSIITKIDKDHSHYLGNTIEEIALEKAGIMKSNSLTIISEENKSLNKVFSNYSVSKSVEFEWASNDYLKNIHFTKDLTLEFDLKFNDINLRNVKVQLAGKHQINNIDLALSAIKRINEKYKIPNDAIYNGFKNLKKNSGYFGRINNLQGQLNINFPIIIDVAHNPNAIEKTFDTISTHFPNVKEWNIIFGVMKDKDFAQSLSLLKPFCKNLIITEPKIDRSAKIDEIKKIAENLNFDSIKGQEIDELPKFILDQNEPTLLVGSFYLLGDFINSLEKMLNIRIEI